MNVLLVLPIAVGLAMDASAVSMCKGLAVGKVKLRHCLIAGGYFGLFQGLMPAIGYALARFFADYIIAFDHWIAFVLLALIGANMLRESFGEEEEGCDCQTASFAPRVMIPMAIATSIDAMATGVTFMSMGWGELLIAVTIIAVVTFLLSAFAVWLGSLVGNRLGAWAERLGGVILILIGTFILLEGLGVFTAVS